MNQVFVDTSGWLAIVVASDQYHSEAVLHYERFRTEETKLITHEGVLIEVGNMLSPSRSRSVAVELRTKIIASSRIELAALTNELIDDAWDLYSKRADKDWSIVDCMSFLVMERRGIVEALTDRHFEQAGFTKLL
ncbi:MAG: type II toxin-antitoxin system VapC family toxin [Pyrinomonadaceae bacterium]